MYEQGRPHARSYEVCASVMESFVPRNIEMHLLLIRGMFFRPSVDLASPFTMYAHENYYVIVMIEHCGKRVEVAAWPSKESS